MRFYSKIRSDKFWGSWIRNITNWGGQRSKIGVRSLEECPNVTDCFISSIHNICVRRSNVDEIIGISILNLLPDYLQLEVHCFWVKGNRSRDIGDGLTDIMDYSVEHCVWVYIHG